MRRAGTVVGAAQGVAVLRAADDDPPGIGPAVVDETLTTVGRIVDVIGPVDAPYLVVTMNETSPTEYLGDVLYLR